MGGLFPTTYERDLVATPSHTPSQLTSNGTPSALVSSPQPSAGPSLGEIQPRTILLIVIGSVGFIILLLVAAFLSKFSCTRRSQSAAPILVHARPRRDHQDHQVSTLCNAGYYRCYHPHRIHNLPPTEHSQLPVVDTSVRAFTDRRSQAWFPPAPPYGGPSPPPYSKSKPVAVRLRPLPQQQRLLPPERVVVET